MAGLLSDARLQLEGRKSAGHLSSYLTLTQEASWITKTELLFLLLSESCSY